MTATQINHRSTGVDHVRSEPCPQEIEAWIDEVRPVLAALQGSAAPTSSGQRNWLLEQERFASRAIDILECFATEAESWGTPCDDLHWVHTKVCAVLERIAALSASVAA